MNATSLFAHNDLMQTNAPFTGRTRFWNLFAPLLVAVVTLLSSHSGYAADDAAAKPGAAAAADADGEADARFRAYIALLRADLRSGKVQIFTDVMRLSGDEAKIFWPIYQDYETEFFALGDRRLTLIKTFADAYNKSKLDDAATKNLTKDWFKQQEDRLKLWAKYQKRIEKDLSAIRAAQFIQIENRLNALTDLLIASEVPIVEPGLGAKAAAAKP